MSLAGCASLPAGAMCAHPAGGSSGGWCPPDGLGPARYAIGSDEDMARHAQAAAWSRQLGAPHSDPGGAPAGGKGPVVGLAVVATALLAALPFVSALALVADANYRFWFGTALPRAALSAFAIVLLVTCSAAACVRRRLQGGGSALALVASTFLVKVGLVSILVSIPLAKQAESLSRALSVDAIGSFQVGGDFTDRATALWEYSQVLQNIRRSDDCYWRNSVVECAGFQRAAPYTDYAWHMEDELRCAGFFYEAQAAPGLAAGGAARGARAGHPLGASASAVLAVDDSPATAESGPLPLFSPGHGGSASCQLKVATEAAGAMRSLSGHLFFQGICLVVGAAALCVALLVVWGVDGANKQKRLSRGI